MAQRLGGGEPSVRRAQDHIDQRVARFRDRQFAPQDAGHVKIDMLGHGARRARIAGKLDDGKNRIADDIALAGREGVHRIAGGGHQRQTFGGGRRGVHVVEAGALGRRFGRLQNIDVPAGTADLFEIAERLFLDGCEAAGNIALGRL